MYFVVLLDANDPLSLVLDYENLVYCCDLLGCSYIHGNFSLSALNALSFLKSSADSAESRLISALESKVKQGIIKVIPGINCDHSAGSYVSY